MNELTDVVSALDAINAPGAPNTDTKATISENQLTQKGRGKLLLAGAWIAATNALNEVYCQLPQQRIAPGDGNKNR